MDSERCKNENWEQNVISVLVNPAIECESEDEDSAIQSSSGISEPTNRKEENEIETERNSNLSESGSEKLITLTHQSNKDPSNTKLEFIKESKNKGSIELVEAGKARKKSSSKISRKMSQGSVEQTGILDRVFNSTQSRDLKETFSLKLQGFSGTKDLEHEVSGTMAEENGVGLFIKKCVRKKSWSFRALPGECIFSMKDHSEEKIGEDASLTKNTLVESVTLPIDIKMENYDGVSGVYLGPSRTLDEYDLEYLNGDITENDDIQDSYRPPSPLSIDSFSGIYIGPEEKRKTRKCEGEEDEQNAEDEEEKEEEVLLSSSAPVQGPEVGKKKKRRGLFFFNTYSAKGGSEDQANMDRNENLCFQLFKRSFNIGETG